MKGTLTLPAFIIFLLALVGSSCIYFQDTPQKNVAVVENVNKNLIELLHQMEREAGSVTVHVKTHKTLPNSQFAFCVWRGDSIVAWNNNQHIPAGSSLAGDYEIKFLRSGSSQFIVKKWLLADDTWLVGLLPLHIQYKIRNEYLTPYWNKAIFNNDPLDIFEPEIEQGFPVTWKDVVLFKMLPASNNQSLQKVLGWAAIASFSLMIILLGHFINKKIGGKVFFSNDINFLLVCVLIFGFRIGLLVFGFPAGIINSELFDAKVFASAEWNPSLGDFFLNALTVWLVCLYLFFNYSKFLIWKKIWSAPLFKWLLSVFSCLAVLFGILFNYVVIQTIYNNSSISLSITQSLQVDYIRLITLLIAVISSLSAFMFIHVFTRLLMFDNNRLRVVASIVIGVMLFVGINLWDGQYFYSSLIIGLSYLTVILIFRLYRSIRLLGFTSIVYFFIAVMALALNGVVAIHHHEVKRAAQNQFRFANNFLIERDYFAEYLLGEAAARISNDVFIQSRLSSPLLGKDIIKQKISQVILPGYFSRYNLKVLLYASSGEALEDTGAISFAQLVALYDQEAYRTDYKNIFFVTDALGGFARKYIALVPISKTSNALGYIVLELSLKRIIPESVYPELLVDSRFHSGYVLKDISYAILNNGNIEYSAGEFNYRSLSSSLFGNYDLYKGGMESNGFMHAAVKSTNERIAIVSSPKRTFADVLSDFSFLVVTGMIVIFIWLLTRGISELTRFKNIYLATRIQLILNVSIFLSLLAVSSITLTLTNRSSLQQLTREYIGKAKQMGEKVSNAMVSSSIDSDQWESNFTALAGLINIDANVFTPTGKLKATSQPLIFENHLLSNYANPTALSKILQGEKVFILSEQVGSLQFYSVYASLLSPDTGELIGILSIPFFQSTSSLEQLQKEVLSNILSIFALLFIALLFISYAVTKWLTAPLLYLTKTISHVSLTHENKRLVWNSNDEIGLLIQEYNTMLEKLKASLAELERNQRELAWREIAQQVAHEIKNPLTPMKLTLQQLERTLEKDTSASAKWMSAVQSLLVQTNTLNEIASSFSLFAKMPEPVLKRIELNSLLARIVELHAQEGLVVFEPLSAKALIQSDEQLLSRIFSNIILNGLQAAAEGTIAKVTVTLEIIKNGYRIRILDNGPGIDPSLRGKIFLPHFTTKKSGSGLGLAIVRQGVDQLGGRISFETSPSGTMFIIDLQSTEA